MKERRDQITITGAPAAWRLGSASRRLAGALRQGGFVPRRAAIVLSVSCVDAGEMTRLNARYRGKNRPTDVLSFEQPGGVGRSARGGSNAPRDVAFLGDLVLCVPVARAQARAHGHGVRDEAFVLLAHGLLHLLGYDHERSATEDARMARAEGRLLRLAGALERAGLIRRSKVRD